MFNFTPPHWKNVLFFLLFICTLSACTCGSSSKSSTDAPHPDTVPYFANSLYYNNDSLMEYARRAYLDDDADALCVTGAAAYLHMGDSAALDTLSVVPLDEADIMLIHAVELGSPDARRLIRYLEQVGLWTKSIPE